MFHWPVREPPHNDYIVIKIMSSIRVRCNWIMRANHMTWNDLKSFFRHIEATMISITKCQTLINCNFANTRYTKIAIDSSFSTYAPYNMQENTCKRTENWVNKDVGIPFGREDACVTTDGHGARILTFCGGFFVFLGWHFDFEFFFLFITSNFPPILCSPFGLALHWRRFYRKIL